MGLFRASSPKFNRFDGAFKEGRKVVEIVPWHKLL